MPLHHDAAVAKRMDVCFESRLTAHKSSRGKKDKQLPLGSRDQKAPCNLLNSMTTKVQLELFVQTSSLERVPAGIPLFQKEGNLYKATTQLSILILMLILGLLHPVSSPLSNPSHSNRFNPVPTSL
jgi:hypothetical protein